MEKLNHILGRVEKPARYIGGEYNQTVKDREKVQLRVALCFPDTYEIGMSNLGIRIIYGILNSDENVWCERVFAPWPDMEKEMRARKVTLYALESQDAIRDFDIIAFSLGYELLYTNVLNMLDLAGVELRSNDRGENAPIILAGGACCANPEPLADFIDLFVIGEGEEVVTELIDLCMKNKKNKQDFLRAATSLEGVYIPSMHVKGVRIKKRTIRDLDSVYFPTNPIVPSMGIVHDRVAIEIFRGCKNGCKFCQAGRVYNPVRLRSPEVLLKQAEESIANTGYDELALLSLSTSDYPQIEDLCDDLLAWCEPRRINLSLPSLRVDSFGVKLMQKVQKVRKSGLTFAPEAGTARLRDHIGKSITEENLLSACKTAFAAGYNTVKLYFMLGLPTETDEDVRAIAYLAQMVVGVWKESTTNPKRGVRITVSTSCFVPKPHTPFEREAQIPIREYLRRVELLREAIRSKKIKYVWHSPEQGLIEAALSRGDRRIGEVIKRAHDLGARLDSWSEHFSLDTWLQAFNECGIDPDEYATRKRTEDEELPWSFIAL